MPAARGTAHQRTKSRRERNPKRGGRRCEPMKTTVILHRTEPDSSIFAQERWNPWAMRRSTANLTDRLLSELPGYTLSVGRELMSGSPDMAGEGQMLYSGKAQFTG